MIGRAIFNKKPLPHNRFAPLPPGAVRASGWLREQLQMQLGAVKSTLARRFPGASGDSSWLGGGLDDGESAPEALSALAMIAYVTGDEELMAVVKRFVDWTMANQNASGDIGPAGMTDWWPKVMMTRVLRLYACATADREAFKCLDRFFRFQLRTLAERPLTGLAVARSGENLQSALFLYNLTEQDYLLKLCTLIRVQSLDWTNEFAIFPHIRPMAKHLPWKALKAGLAREGELNGVDQSVHNREYHLTQAVNVAMGLKTPGMINLFKSGFKEVGAFKQGWGKLIKQHGVALSMFTGDDHLAGTNPSQGVNLSAVAEAMNSLATLIGTGDEFGFEMADTLEKLGYNALPAAWSLDMTARQAIEQVNQIDATDAARPFYNAPDDALCYRARPLGLADQGLALLTSSLWYATSDDGLAAVGYAPCAVTFVAGGERVRVEVEGDYPFAGTVRLRVSAKNPCEFPLYLRIPGWADQVMLTLPDGELMQMRGGEIACVRRRWTEEETVVMDMPMEPRLTNWPRQTGAIEVGPLLMALDAADDAAWNFSLVRDEPMKLVAADAPARAFKSGGRGMAVLVKAARVDDWTRDGANCALAPVAPVCDRESEVIKLVPYGDTDLRIAQFPIAQSP